jgi:hypothetical protein
VRWSGQCLAGQLQIRDALGRMMHSQPITCEGQLNLVISDWPSGMYILSLHEEKGIHTERFVVENTR